MIHQDILSGQVQNELNLDNKFDVRIHTLSPRESIPGHVHHHRTEIWIVINGVARVVKENGEFLLYESQSHHVSIGEVHALENPGVIPLEIMEIRAGRYLGEDDVK